MGLGNGPVSLERLTQTAFLVPPGKALRMATLDIWRWHSMTQWIFGQV
jgi:hypothetical protein